MTEPTTGSDKGQRPPRKRLDAPNRLWQKILREDRKWRGRKEMDIHQHCLYNAQEPSTEVGEWGLGRDLAKLDTRKRKPRGVPRLEAATFINHSHKYGNQPHRHMSSQPKRSHLQEKVDAGEGQSG